MSSDWKASEFFVSNWTSSFQSSFLILPTLTSVVLQNPIFKNYRIAIDPKRNLLEFPIWKLLNQILPQQDSKPYYTTKVTWSSVVSMRKILIPPQSRALLEFRLAKLFWSVQIMYRTFMRHILKNIKAKSSSQVGPFFPRDVRQLSSCKRANIGCSRVWNFFHERVAILPLECHWSRKNCQNVQNFGFF